MAGYPVDACYVLHVKPIKRGGQEPCAQLIEFNFEYKNFQSLLDIFWLKVYNNQVDWEERSDELAIKKGEVESSTTPVSAPELTTQGQNTDTQDTSSSFAEPAMEQPAGELLYGGQRQAGTPSLSPSHVVWMPAQNSQTTRSTTPQESPTDETSSPQTETPLSIQPGEVVRFVDARHRKFPGTSKRLSATDTLRRPDEVEPDIQQWRRRGIV